jgi:hypothetical protein
MIQAKDDVVLAKILNIHVVQNLALKGIYYEL